MAVEEVAECEEEDREERRERFGEGGAEESGMIP